MLPLNHSVSLQGRLALTMRTIRLKVSLSCTQFLLLRDTMLERRLKRIGLIARLRVWLLTVRNIQSRS